MSSVELTSAELGFSDLRKANLARQAHWGGSDNWTLADWSNAVAGEVGEACNVVKKLRRPELGTVGNEYDASVYRDQLESEIGDVLIYLDLLANAAKLDLGECVSRAFNEKSAKLNMPVRLEPSLARSGLEARKAEESMRERAAAHCEGKANKHGWNYHLPSVGRELAHDIRALPLTGDKP